MKSALAALLRMVLTLTVLSGAVASTAGVLFLLNQSAESEAGVTAEVRPLSRGVEEEHKVAPLSAERQRVAAPPAPFTIERETTGPAVARPQPVRIETLSRREWRDLLGGAPRRNGKDRWATVTATSLNVRAEPGLMADVKTQLSRGTHVEVIEVRDGWSRVRATESEDSGWVSSRFLKTAEAPKPERSAARKTGNTIRK